MLEELIKDKIDIFLISEIKLDSSFPRGQFVITGYTTPFRLDRNQNGEGLLLYVREQDIHKTFILNSSITSHFSYCPIVWIFHSRKLNERINHIHETALRIVYKDFNSSFEELLIEDNFLNIHHRNLQKLMTEIFKVKNGLSPELKTILPTNNFAFQVEEYPFNQI